MPEDPRRDGWPYFDLDDEGSARLYYRPAEGQEEGFRFSALTWVSTPVTDRYRADQPPLDNPDAEVEQVVSGVAYFDGVRHMDWGDQGYLNYPDMGCLEALIQKLRQLEKRFCSDA
jgi:hypothetical protein